MTRRGLMLLTLGCLALGQAGCLVLAAGAAGSAAVGYAYLHGRVAQTYNAAFADTWQATRTALVELGLPIQSEERDPKGGSIESRTGRGDRVQIYVETVPSPIPAEGTVTRVSVRVATFGDPDVSDRILNQVGFHLAPANLPPPGAPVNPAVTPAAVPQQTAAPPLAAPEVRRPG